MSPSVIAIVSVLVVLLGIAAWTARPRLVTFLVLLPVSLVGGIWRQAKRLWALPENVTKWLAYSVLEKDARSMRHHAENALAMWSAGPEFRPAARQILNNVLAGYGIRPVEAAPTLE